MNSLPSTISFPALIAYGLLILIYLLILKLLLASLQQLGKKQQPYRSVVDADIRRTVPTDVDSTMQSYDIRSVANIIARGLVTVVAIAIMIILSTIKIGLLVTLVVVGIVIVLLWAINRLLRQISKTEVTATIRKYTQLGGGNTGSILLLSIALVVVLFLATLLQ
ncbi:MAG: hypothetical protein JWN75_567 [Candidatus Saccharibacteria bacterium]|nr:hypothetical protein [Candidatus Saccharibacteria bacterium]